MYRRGDRLFRQVNSSFAEAFDQFTSCGLYQELASDELLIPHREVDLDLALTPDAYRVLEPEEIPIVTQPREWCPGQLRDAALLTLELQRRALSHGMILKDASAHNVQFVGARPVFIDTLSFAPYTEGQPWPAYRQFCEHFVSPLALGHHLGDSQLALLAGYLDGVPLSATSRALPVHTWLRPSLLLHVHLHAASIRRYAVKAARSSAGSVSRKSLEGLTRHLVECVRSLRWNPSKGEWSAYSVQQSYNMTAEAAKEEIVSRVLSELAPNVVWDLGSNKGHFSRLAATRGAYTLSIDTDLAAVENNYRKARSEREPRLLPLHVDLTNPTPAGGFASEEFESLADRGPADLILALALIHHLAIGRNIPIPRLTEWLAKLGTNLLIEFIPKSDPQVQKLLESRADIFPQYTLDDLLESLEGHFERINVLPIESSRRALVFAERARNRGNSNGSG